MHFIVKSLAYPTENPQRVQEAIENIFGSIPIEIVKKVNFSEISSPELVQTHLTHIRQAIHDKRIIDATRVRLLRNRDELTTMIFLDKQAASVGKLRLLDNENEDPPLGSIELRMNFVTDSEFEQFLTWFSPPTKDGKIIA